MSAGVRRVILVTFASVFGALAVLALTFGVASAGWAFGHPRVNPVSRSAGGHQFGWRPPTSRPSRTAGGNIVVSIAPLPKGFRSECHVAADVPCYEGGSPCTPAESRLVQPGWQGPVVCSDENGWRWVLSARGEPAMPRPR
jgi:hypothetical protein